MVSSAQNAASHVFQEDSVLVKTGYTDRISKCDSLKRLIAGALDDTFKVNRLIYLVNDGCAGQNDTAILHRVKTLSEKLGYYPGIAEACHYMGEWYQAQNKFSSADSLYLLALAIDEAHECYQGIFACFSGALNLYFMEGDFPAAMKLTQRALSVAEKTGNTSMTASYDNLFGFIYLREGNFDEAKKYYGRYFNLALQLKDSLAIADAYSCLGDVYAGLRQIDFALASFFKARLIYSNKGNFKNFLPAPGDVSKQKERLAYTHFKISGAYTLSGGYIKALLYADSVFTYANATICNKYDLAAYYINHGVIYQHLQNYRAALPMLKNGLALANQINHREDIRDAYAALAETYAALHRYDSAYFFSTIYTRLKDSIVNEESRIKVAEMQVQYDSEKKYQETARQNLAKNILIIGSLVLVTIIFLLYSRYLLLQKNKYQAQANKQQAELFSVVVAAQDKERKRIAQDIHDSLGSVISAAKLNLSGLEGDKTLFTNTQREKYETALALLDDASVELRNISHNLMPATLSKLGLVAALQNLFEKISATGIHIHFVTHGIKERLGEAMEISIYRVMLELVNNIVKHAAAYEVTVQVIRYPERLNITIEDNGRGFNYGQATTSAGGMGLGNVLSRIEYLKGAMHVDSGTGAGTTVIIDIPMGDNTSSTV